MRRGASFYILIVLALAALGWLVWALAPGRTLDTPEVVLSSAPARSAPPVQEDSAAGTVIDVTPETVKTVIGTLSRASAYSRTLRIQSFWNGGSSTAEIDVRVLDGSTRLTIREPSGQKQVLLRDGEAWIWYNDPRDAWHGPAREGDADVYQRLLTYEDVLSLRGDQILEAGYTSYQGENCVYVRYTGGPLGYENLCYISDATGLLMGTETYDGGTLVYAMQSTAPDLTPPDADYFKIP